MIEEQKNTNQSMNIDDIDIPEPEYIEEEQVPETFDEYTEYMDSQKEYEMNDDGIEVEF